MPFGRATDERAAALLTTAPRTRSAATPAPRTPRVVGLALILRPRYNLPLRLPLHLQGLRRYWEEPFDRFDGIVVVLSLVDASITMAEEYGWDFTYLTNTVDVQVLPAFRDAFAPSD